MGRRAEAHAHDLGASFHRGEKRVDVRLIRLRFTDGDAEHEVVLSLALEEPGLGTLQKRAGIRMGNDSKAHSRVMPLGARSGSHPE